MVTIDYFVQRVHKVGRARPRAIGNAVTAQGQLSDTNILKGTIKHARADYFRQDQQWIIDDRPGNRAPLFLTAG